MMTCNDSTLNALLDADEETGEYSADLSIAAQHVEICSHCQSRLSELAGDAAHWHEAQQWLSTGGVENPEYAESLAARKRCNRPAAWTDAMAKSLLSAASHPEMLGRIGRYDVERLIGSGGMGVVFKAYDTELNRPVAVKLLAPYLAGNGAARKRFAREARAAAAVVDDHVVPIHNVETEGENPFLVMKYIAGGSLQQRLDREGPLDVLEVLRIGMQTAKGLAAAHAQGLIHRDVKPSNILLDEGVDRALLTDFGLARGTDDASLTRSGIHPGTPHYMSPEQVRGEAIDARSDLFGLGCVLYALCTGHPPFRSETSYAVLRRITDDTPRPIRETNPDVPAWLEQIVMKLLAKSRDERFDSAEEVAELLEDCLAHVQNPTTTPLPAPVATLVKSFGISGDKRGAESFGDFRYPPIRKFVAAAAFAFLLIFAGVLIVLELNKGTLTIESDVDNVPIRIIQGDSVVEQMTVTKAGTSTRIAAGKYVVEVENGDDGLVIEGGTVSLMRGETRTVKIVQNVRAGDGGSARMLNEAVGSESDADFARRRFDDKVTVDLYCGIDVVPQMNTQGAKKAKHVRLLQSLNAIECVVVNFREDGSGNDISKVIVRDPSQRCQRESMDTGSPSEVRTSINSALQAADVWKVTRWFEGGPTEIESTSEPIEKVSPSTTTINPDVPAQGKPVDKNKLLNELRERDRKFSRRSVELERSWDEAVSPRGMASEAQFQSIKFGQADPGIPEGLPENYQQPHRIRYIWTGQNFESTLEILVDLETAIHPEHGKLASRTIESDCFNYQRFWNRDQKIFSHNSDIAKLCGGKKAWEYLLPSGFGFTPSILKVSNAVEVDGGYILKGLISLPSATIGNRKNCFELHLDKDLILRRAVIQYHVYDFVIVTSGRSEFAGVPPLAKHAAVSIHHIGQDEKRSGDAGNYRYEVISLSERLSKDEYDLRVNFAIPKGTKLATGLNVVEVNLQGLPGVTQTEPDQPALRPEMTSREDWPKSPSLKAIHVIADGDELANSRNPVLVRFRVESIRRKGRIAADGTKTELWVLSSQPYTGSLDPNALDVYIEPSVEDAFSRIGISNLAKHFQDKQIEVEARVHQSRLGGYRINNDPRHERKLHSMTVSSISQIRIVDEAAEGETVPETDETSRGDERAIDAVTLAYNDSTRQLRLDLFDPPIPDLTTQQMRTAMLDAAKVYRRAGKQGVASALEQSVEMDRLVDELTFGGMSGTSQSNPGGVTFRQITPAFIFKHESQVTIVFLSKAELRYSRNGWSSSTWGDIHPPITGTWELVSIERHGETLVPESFNQWKQHHASWTRIVVDNRSLSMIGDDTATYDFEIDYNSGPVPEFQLSQKGEAKFQGVLMGNGFVDDTTLHFALDIDGKFKPKTFRTDNGKTTVFGFRRALQETKNSNATPEREKGEESNGAELSTPQTTLNYLHRGSLADRADFPAECYTDEALLDLSGMLLQNLVMMSGLSQIGAQTGGLLGMDDGVPVVSGGPASFHLQVDALLAKHKQKNPPEASTKALELLAKLTLGAVLSQEESLVTPDRQLIRMAAGILRSPKEFIPAASRLVKSSFGDGSDIK